MDLNAIAERRWACFAGLLWLLPLLVITIMVIAQPLKRTVTPLYHESVEHFTMGPVA